MNFWNFYFRDGNFGGRLGLKVNAGWRSNVGWVTIESNSVGSGECQNISDWLMLGFFVDQPVNLAAY